MVKKELWFIAEGEDGSNYWVRKKGRSIYISGPNGHEHLCHASITNQDKVKSEIFHVFHTKVVKIKQL
ncbi:hypothetical protein IQ227_19365 [Anabaena aphanizomenioides LEGE 00250]|jgi:hypothetical protein|uniref:Uncharacterized protein n=1 Tax=Sphaerospermopsis aphanizomenoides LEGE 00250 TaxID=2777972 RepID=A0ABR9VL52_9CYAN|nr:hypothetical protein [Sphaerospermopsis aphanizomenoides]MBE9238125.1 hypothetical protein [Sphaerospermopsis aphanizomenoides LEGE 00250]